MPDQPMPQDFHGFYLSDELARALDAIGYERPTPVQGATIPLIMAGIDLIVQSQTGTGKTAAFGIPLVEMLEPEPGRIEVLVLAPTRELAKQVSAEFERLSRYRPLTSCAIYGGSSYAPQIEALATSQIVCATPGRLLDLLEQGELTLEHLRFFVLDEADEMLSMGFERQLNAVRRYLPEERQSLLFSATVTEDIKALARDLLFYPEYLSFSSDSVVNKDVDHTYYRVGGIARMRDMVKMLEYVEPEAAIIFANTKDDTFLLANFLQRHGYRAEVLNGDLPQPEREATLKKLRQGSIDYLVATDVAARGIDISDLSHVINYVLPESPEVYVHRTGRTGRAGKKGSAISLVSPAEAASLIQIMKQTEVELEERDFPTTADVIEAKRARIGSTLARRVEALGLAHASYLAAARTFLEAGGDEEERAIALAKIFAAAARATEPSLASAPEPQERDEIEAPSDEPEAPNEAAEAEEASEAEEGEPRRGRRRPRQVEEAEERAPVAAKTPEVAEAQEPEERAPEQDERPRRGRSSRRRRGREERAAAAEPQAAAEDRGQRERAPERDERPRRGRSSRRRSDRAPRQERASEERAKKRDFDLAPLWMNLGRDMFGDPSEVLDFLVFNSGMDAEDFGEVRIERSHSFVDVRVDYLHDVIGAIDELEVKGSRLSARPARRG